MNKKKIIEDFIEKVERKAEEKMLITGKLEGAHYAAMKEVAKDYEKGKMKCTCKGLQKAIKAGTKSMKKENASQFAISSYVFDMVHGDWIECKCDAVKKLINKILRLLGLVKIKHAKHLSGLVHKYYVECVLDAVEKDFDASRKPEAVKKCIAWWDREFDSIIQNDSESVIITNKPQFGNNSDVNFKETKEEKK